MSRVHPRSRGAAELLEADIDDDVGPSPLTRGSLLALLVAGPGDGSIPAHAGQPR